MSMKVEVDTKFKQKPLSKKHEKFLNKAIELSKTSDCVHKHGAVIVRGSKVISAGVNNTRNNPAFMPVPCPKKYLSVHAEQRALRLAKKTENLSGAIIYIARTNNNGEPMNSKPCKDCIKALKAVGIRKVFYTVNNEMDLYED